MKTAHSDRSLGLPVPVRATSSGPALRAYHLVLTTALATVSSACGRWGFEEVHQDLVRDLTTADASVFGGSDASPLNPPEGPFPDRVEGDAETGADAALPADAGEADASMEPKPADLHLVHHYRFDGTGPTALDSVGTAHGKVSGVSLDGSGDLTLPGGFGGPHVTLPSGIISSLESVSIETWFTWSGGGGYQRIFDFGNNTQGASKQGQGTRHFSLALAEGRNFIRLVYDQNVAVDSSKWRAVFSGPAPSTGVEHQVVAVFDKPQNQIRLYLDGARRAEVAVPANEGLSDIDDVNAWLGMGQWASDPNFTGTLHDVRIYDVPLTDAEVSARFADRYP